jgi:multiple sugar transport system permease protein/fructooligosaccharide transport system permease protein
VKCAWKWAIGAAVAALFLAPLVWLLCGSFLPSSAIFHGDVAASPLSRDWTLANYPNAIRRAGLGRALLNTMLQVATIAIGGLLVNSMAAFAFARLSFRGREPLFALLVSLIILPVEVLAVPMFLTTRDLGLGGSTSSLLAALSLPFVAKAFNVYFLRQQFLSWPSELEEAAVLDGASTWRVFWSVALPSMRPALATVVLLDIVTHWSDFLWPLLVTTREGTRTVQIGLANLFTEPPIDWGAILACAVLATLPVFIGFRFLQRHLAQADARVGLR